MKRKLFLASIITIFAATLGAGSTYAANDWDSCAETDVAYFRSTCYSDINAVFAQIESGNRGSLYLIKDGTYTLTRDYNNIIFDATVAASNVVLDGGGHTITTDSGNSIVNKDAGGNFSLQNINFTETGTNPFSLTIGEFGSGSFANVYIKDVNFECVGTCGEGNGVIGVAVISDNTEIDNLSSSGEHLAAGLAVIDGAGGTTSINNSYLQAAFGLFVINAGSTPGTIDIKNSQISSIAYMDESGSGSAHPNITIEDAKFDESKDILLLDEALDPNPYADLPRFQNYTTIMIPATVSYTINRKLELGDSAELSEILPYDILALSGDSTVSLLDGADWRSSDSSVAELKDATLRTKRAGTADITATFTRGDTKLAVTLHITVSAPTGGETNPNTLDMLSATGLLGIVSLAVALRICKRQTVRR